MLMRLFNKPIVGLMLIFLLWPAGGCATLRTTDPTHTATEQFLMTEAVTRAVQQLSPEMLRDRLVFVDSQFLSVEQQQFLLGELRAALLMAGVRMAEKRDDAQIIVEARSGGVGIDRYDYLLGIPAFVLPLQSGTGTPLVTPELALFKSLKQRGYASIAFAAYWSKTGELIASSGPFIGKANRADYWFLGTGPRTIGNIPTVEKPQ